MHESPSIVRRICWPPRSLGSPAAVDDVGVVVVGAALPSVDSSVVSGVVGTVRGRDDPANPDGPEEAGAVAPVVAGLVGGGVARRRRGRGAGDGGRRRRRVGS